MRHLLTRRYLCLIPWLRSILLACACVKWMTSASSPMMLKQWLYSSIPCRISTHMVYPSIRINSRPTTLQGFSLHQIVRKMSSSLSVLRLKNASSGTASHFSVKTIIPPSLPLHSARFEAPLQQPQCPHQHREHQKIRRRPCLPCLDCAPLQTILDSETLR